MKIITVVTYVKMSASLFPLSNINSVSFNIAGIVLKYIHNLLIVRKNSLSV